MASVARASRARCPDSLSHAASRLGAAEGFPVHVSSSRRKRRIALRYGLDRYDGSDLRYKSPRVREGVIVGAVSEGLPIYEIATGASSRLSLVYLGTLVTMLLGAAYFVVRQVLVRVEMDEAMKRLGDSIRAGNATSEVHLLTLFYRSHLTLLKDLL